ncbi:MAG: hypothetical protein ACXAB4_00310 [Candidatus Hodarchaeales archaeon]|jgi:hypothetical protein
MKDYRLYIVIVWFTGLLFAHAAVSPCLAQEESSTLPTIATNWLGEQSYHIGDTIYIELVGTEHEGLIAAGWIRNTSTEDYIPNTAFRELIRTDFHAVLQTLNVTPYPIQNVTWLWNVDSEGETADPTTADFVPLYCLARFDMADDYIFDSVEAYGLQWKAHVNAIVTSLQDKWYIAHMKGETLGYAGGGGGNSGLPAFDFSLVALGLTFSGLWLLRRRRLPQN